MHPTDHHSGLSPLRIVHYYFRLFCATHSPLFSTCLYYVFSTVLDCSPLHTLHCSRLFSTTCFPLFLTVLCNIFSSVLGCYPLHIFHCSWLFSATYSSLFSAVLYCIFSCILDCSPLRIPHYTRLFSATCFLLFSFALCYVLSSVIDCSPLHTFHCCATGTSSQTTCSWTAPATSSCQTLGYANPWTPTCCRTLRKRRRCTRRKRKPTALPATCAIPRTTSKCHAERWWVGEKSPSSCGILHTGRCRLPTRILKQLLCCHCRC